jgi:hypothetical protein
MKLQNKRKTAYVRASEDSEHFRGADRSGAARDKVFVGLRQASADA